MPKKDEETIKSYELYEVVDGRLERLVFVTDCIEDMRDHLNTIAPEKPSE